MTVPKENTNEKHGNRKIVLHGVERVELIFTSNTIERLEIERSSKRISNIEDSDPVPEGE